MLHINVIECLFLISLNLLTGKHVGQILQLGQFARSDRLICKYIDYLTHLLRNNIWTLPNLKEAADDNSKINAQGIKHSERVENIE